MKKLSVKKLIGYILLLPTLISVPLFFIQLTTRYNVFRVFNNTSWTGNIFVDSGYGGGGGYSSTLPLYFGLMAIAGSILIKED